jgi:hypothetical protein
MMTRALLVLILAVVGLWGQPTAEAGLSVSPSRTVIEGKPGQKLAGEFDLGNVGTELIAVTVEPEDWAGGVGGNRGSVPWLAIKPKQFELKAGKSRKVKYTIRVPKDAQGELRTQVFFTSAVEGGPGMRSRLGAIIYVTIKDTQTIQGALGEVQVHYTASTPGIKKPDRLDIALRIHNTSNVHVIPEGEVRVLDHKGQVVARVPMPAGWGLLPGEEDLYHAIGTGIYLQPGKYALEVALKIGEDVRQPLLLQKTYRVKVTEDFQVRVEDPAPLSP